MTCLCRFMHLNTWPLRDEDVWDSYKTFQEIITEGNKSLWAELDAWQPGTTSCSLSAA